MGGAAGYIEDGQERKDCSLEDLYDLVPPRLRLVLCVQRAKGHERRVVRVEFLSLDPAQDERDAAWQSQQVQKHPGRPEPDNAPVSPRPALQLRKGFEHLYSYGIYSYGLKSYGLYSYGLTIYSLQVELWSV